MIKNMITKIMQTTVNRQMFIGVIAMLMAVGVARAQTQIEDDALIYVVQPGDTLYQLSEQFLEDPAHWPGLAKDADVKVPRHLQPGQVVRLPIDLLRHENKDVRVAFERGQASVSQGGGTGRPLSRGMLLTEGQTIETGADGFVSLELPDQSRLLLSANSRLRINQFRYVPDVDKFLIDFVLEAGYVESAVTPQPANSRFRVSTPLAVTGVRGTRFGVALSDDAQTQTNDVTDGAVALSPAKPMAANVRSSDVVLAAGQGSVVSAHAFNPQVRDLLPAPDLKAWSPYAHASSWTPPEVVVASASGYVVQVSPENEPEQIIFESRGSLLPVEGLADGSRYRVQVRGGPKKLNRAISEI